MLNPVPTCALSHSPYGRFLLFNPEFSSPSPVNTNHLHTSHSRIVFSSFLIFPVFPFDFLPRVVPSISPARSQNRPTSRGRAPNATGNVCSSPLSSQPPASRHDNGTCANLVEQCFCRREPCCSEQIPSVPDPSTNPGSVLTEPPDETCTNLILTCGGNHDSGAPTIASTISKVVLWKEPVIFVAAFDGLRITTVLHLKTNAKLRALILGTSL